MLARGYMDTWRDRTAPGCGLKGMDKPVDSKKTQAHRLAHILTGYFFSLGFQITDLRAPCEAGFLDNLLD